MFQFIVEIYGRTLQSADYLNIAALQFDSPSDAVAAPFLGFMATLPFVAGSSSDAEAARAWVESTLPTLGGQGDIREKTFGGVPFQLFGIPTARSLRIGLVE